MAGDVIDVLIVGGGVAGAAAASMLASAGRRVVLVDKHRFPRSKVCGGCLNARALAAMERMNLLSALEEVSREVVHGIWLCSESREVRLEFDEPELSVNRSALDFALVKLAISRGVELLEEHCATGSRLEEDARVVELRGPAGKVQLRAGTVLACDGLGSALARDAGLAVEAPRVPRAKVGVSCTFDDCAAAQSGWIRMLCGKSGYVGMVSIGEGTTVAAALAASKINSGAWNSVRRIANECGVALPEVPGNDFVACPRLNRRVVRPWAERLLLVGDAAGYVEPITGEGMAWALEGAEAAAQVLANGWHALAGERYEGLWRKRVDERRSAALAAARVLDSRVLTRSVFILMRGLPELGKLMASSVNRGGAGLSFRSKAAI